MTVIDAVIEARCLVVIDEAYQRSQAAVTSPRAGHSHVLLMRTLSKFGLAGARIGT